MDDATLPPWAGADRPADLRTAAEGEYDVLVVGLGATGAGIALDAASRGLRVLAVDQGDVASGTSSRSSKLVHGGLRYLERLELGLVREGVVERQLLLRLAPGLVRPMPFAYPVWPDTPKRRLVGVGLSAYDVLAGRSSGPRHRRVTEEQLVAAVPALAGRGARHGFTYRDAATDDARLVLAVVRAARAHGALAITYARVAGLRHDGLGRLCGAVLRDEHSGSVLEVRARRVVNATGAWVDGLMQLAEPGRPGQVTPSKGVHLVLPRHRLPLRGTAVLIPSRQGDGRSMFAIPWGELTVLGTTDTPEAPGAEVTVTEADLDYVLGAGNAVFGGGLVPDDVVSAWAGVRPLVRPGGDRRLKDVSRHHLVTTSPDGLVSITGGKLTTYRRMAQDVVDLLVRSDGATAPCRTAGIPLVGGPAPALQAAELATSGAVEAAVQLEGATTVADVLLRRTRVALREPDAGLSAAGWVAEQLTSALGHDQRWAADQLRSFDEQVRRERGAVGLGTPAQTTPV